VTGAAAEGDGFTDETTMDDELEGKALTEGTTLDGERLTAGTTLEDNGLAEDTMGTKVEERRRAALDGTTLEGRVGTAGAGVGLAGGGGAAAVVFWVERKAAKTAFQSIFDGICHGCGAASAVPTLPVRKNTEVNLTVPTMIAEVYP